MEDTLKLYAIGEIDEEQLLHRVIVQADHTLTGKLVDPTETFRSWNRLIEDATATGRELATYGVALKDRVHEILRVMTGAEGETKDLLTALKDKVHAIGDDLRDEMRAEAHAAELTWEKEMSSRWSKNTLIDFKDMLAKLRQDYKERTGKDIDEAYAEQKAADDNPDTQQVRMELASRANLAFHGGEVGPTTDRTWRGTTYVSRSPGSIWARKELPSALAPFVASSPRDMDAVIRSIGFEHP